MKKYDSYKDSGVEWIGEIPSHWDISKLKFVCKIFNGDSLKDEEKELYSQKIENAIPYVSTKDIDVHTSKINYKNGLSIPVDHSKYKIAPKNSFLMCIEGGSAGRKYSHLEKDVFFVNKLACFETKTQNNKFLYYYSQSPLFQLQFQNSLSGLIGGVAISQIRNFSAIIPFPNEQTAIANYLDQKTTQIDHLIAKKEQFIQLLEEERVAVINQAVTKGLDPKVPMKDSGIEWLGEIPEHWEVKRIKHTTYVKGRIGWKGLRSDEFLEFSDSYVVTGTDFDNGNVKWETCYQVPLDRYEDDPFIKLKNNDLLITKDGTIGKIAIVKDMPKIATLNSGVFLTRPQNNEYLQEYMYWILYSDVFKTFYDYNKSGSTIQHLYQNVFNEFKYTLPSLKEQTEIVKYLDKKNVEINQIKHKAQHEIELLKEYKTALISEVVTGKVDVRNEKLNK